MLRLNETASPPQPMVRQWACLLGALVLAGAASAGQANEPDSGAFDAAARPTTYRVINLRPASDSLTGQQAFNANDQLMFSTNIGLSAHGWFYDGTRLIDIGYLNAQSTIVSAINDAGQISGDSFITDLGGEGGSGEIYHAFVWSKSGGMRDIGTLGGPRGSGARAINNLGQVVGQASAPDGRQHAFRWSAGEGMLDLGLLASGPESFSTATAINDAGKVAGTSATADGNFHAFRWSPRTGMIDLGTLGGNMSMAVAIDAEGNIAGDSTVRTSCPHHAFIWTRQGGMLDLGAGGGFESYVDGMSASGQMFGKIFRCNGSRRAFSWTRATGMLEIGTFGGRESIALGANKRGRIVGTAFTTNDEDVHAFVWSAQRGLVDLNRRLRGAPAGLVLYTAYAISDNGHIFAVSNAGLVLLVPDTGRTVGHAVGPITAPGMVQAGSGFESSVSFAGEDTAAGHNVMWNWGDGNGNEQGNARERKGTGLASAYHAYAAPGIYIMTAQVGERSGIGATVSRTVVAYDPAPGTFAGSGWFMARHAAHKGAPLTVDKAQLSFMVPAASGARAGKVISQLHLAAAGFNFRSDNVRLAATHGARASFDGSGTINGRGDYLFTLQATPGAAGKGEPGRVGLKIWHIDPATRTAIVDVDNEQEDPSGKGSRFYGDIRAY